MVFGVVNVFKAYQPRAWIELLGVNAFLESVSVGQR